MAPPPIEVRTSNCSLLLIYRPREDERLSWPGWLTCSGRFTHIVVRPSAGQGQFAGQRPAFCQLCYATNQPVSALQTPLYKFLSLRLLKMHTRYDKSKSKAEHLYSALHGIQTTLKRSGMDHTVLPAINTIPALLRKRSPDGATTD